MKAVGFTSTIYLLYVTSRFYIPDNLILTLVISSPIRPKLWRHRSAEQIQKAGYKLSDVFTMLVWLMVPTFTSVAWITARFIQASLNFSTCLSANEASTWTPYCSPIKTAEITVSWHILGIVRFASVPPHLPLHVYCFNCFGYNRKTVLLRLHALFYNLRVLYLVLLPATDVEVYSTYTYPE